MTSPSSSGPSSPASSSPHLMSSILAASSSHLTHANCSILPVQQEPGTSASAAGTPRLADLLNIFRPSAAKTITYDTPTTTYFLSLPSQTPSFLFSHGRPKFLSRMLTFVIPWILDYPPTNLLLLLQPSKLAYTTCGPLVHFRQFSMFVLPRLNCTTMLKMTQFVMKIMFLVHPIYNRLPQGNPQLESMKVAGYFFACRSALRTFCRYWLSHMSDSHSCIIDVNNMHDFHALGQIIGIH
ncbi:hypothetical protein F4604DRAFT_12826 [Suillus subluteus]|nr:hypothetical protein F4604DRAFT_12826 [Suillus subluteus]